MPAALRNLCLHAWIGNESGFCLPQMFTARRMEYLRVQEYQRDVANALHYLRPGHIAREAMDQIFRSRVPQPHVVVT